MKPQRSPIYRVSFATLILLLGGAFLYFVYTVVMK
jgi:hypothetical protein